MIVSHAAQQKQNRFARSRLGGTKYFRTTSTGVATTTPPTTFPIVVPKDYVAIIDEITITTMTTDSSTPATADQIATMWIGLQFSAAVRDGNPIPFHIPSVLDQRTAKRFTWRTNGTLVVSSTETPVIRTTTASGGSTTTLTVAGTPYTASAYIGCIVRILSGTNLGQQRTITANTNNTLTVDVAYSAAIDTSTVFEVVPGPTSAPMAVGFSFTNATSAWIAGRYRLVPEAEARQTGWIEKSTPRVASTFALDTSATSNGTARRIVGNPGPNRYIEITSLVFTGHNYNAAADNVQIGFWDGVAGGSFASGAKLINRAWARGVSNVYSAQIAVSDIAIQGPNNYGVYIVPTTNFAGATPRGDWIVTYRITDRNDTYEQTGVPGADGLPISRGLAGGETIANATGTASAGGASSLTDGAKTWTQNAYGSGQGNGHWVKITANTGVGQIRRIVSNTTSVLTVDPAWATQPDNTSTYKIVAQPKPTATKFWYFTEVLPNAGGTNSVAWFPAIATGSANFTAWLQGYTHSGHSGDGAFHAIVGIGGGGDASSPIVEYLPINSDAATPSSVARSDSRDDLMVPIAWSQAPGHTGADPLGIMAARSSLAWGFIDPTVSTGTEYLTAV